MQINGETVALKDAQASNLLALVERYGLEPGAVAVQCNGEIVPRARWAETPLAEEDRIELIRFVGGG